MFVADMKQIGYLVANLCVMKGKGCGQQVTIWGSTKC